MTPSQPAAQPSGQPAYGEAAGGTGQASYGVRLRAQIAADRRADLLVWLTGNIDGLDTPAAARLLDQVAGGRQDLALLRRDYRCNPGLLVSGDGDCSTVGLRLITAIAAAAYRIPPPRCRDCGRGGLTLGRRTSGGRQCASCANQHRARPCGRCGQHREVHALLDGQPVCRPCHDRDPDTGSECSRCGTRGPVAARTAAGQPVCRRCYQPPQHECIHCGRRRRVHTRTPAGPVCQPCHDHPPRRCHGCGQHARIVTKGRAQPLCQHCYQPPVHECDRCGRLAPLKTRRSPATSAVAGQLTGRVAGRVAGQVADHVAGQAAGQEALCHRCYATRPLSACARCRQQRRCRTANQPGALPLCAECATICDRCGRSRRIATTWPIGRVCGTCYAYLRKHPGPCAVCGQQRPLIGRDPAGEAVCGPCAGQPGRDYTCPRCHRAGFANLAGCCLHCQAADRVAELLTDATGTPRTDLAPLAAALTSTDSPSAVLEWLAPGQPAAMLLTQISSAGGPVSHELLDTLPAGLALHRLRQTLIHTGVLPDRVDHLERLLPWLEGLLTDQPAEHAHLIRTYTHWTLLRRARCRARAGRFTPASGGWARTRILAALRLLTWIRQQGLDLAGLSQDHIDYWLTTDTPEATYPARQFLAWARDRRLTGPVAIPKKHPRTSLAPLTEDQRWQQLKRCLHEEALPTAVRAAGALVLLYGLPVSRITALRHHDLHTSPDGRCWLTLGDHELLIPSAVAALLLTQRDQARSICVLTRSHPTGPDWLFPGGFPGQPARTALYRALRRHLPIHLRRARSAALASLAAELPPAVLAQLLDININTAIAWANYTQTDWTAYLAARSQPKNLGPTTKGRPGPPPHTEDRVFQADTEDGDAHARRQ